jgi:hypothetical protein
MQARISKSARRNCFEYTQVCKQTLVGSIVNLESNNTPTESASVCASCRPSYTMIHSGMVDLSLQAEVRGDMGKASDLGEMHTGCSGPSSQAS